jgi:hypothetical protein
VISRRRFLTGFAIALTPLGTATSAQEYKAGKVSRIGFISNSNPTSGTELMVHSAVDSPILVGSKVGISTLRPGGQKET